MALPTILINSSTGSDTAASGAGPATALTGAGASCNATTAVDLSADSPDLSGVAVDGSACLWVDTASGRQYSRITAVDNGTKIVTVATAYGVTASGLTWAIGGKRATLDHADSRTLGADAQAGWIIEIETDQTLSSTTWTLSASGSQASGQIIMRGATNAPRPIITQGANAACLTVTGNRTKICALEIRNSNGTKTSANGIVMFHGSNNFLTIQDCIIGHSTSTLLNGLISSVSSGNTRIIDCEIRYCTSVGISGGTGYVPIIIGCNIHHCTSHGITSNSGGPRITGCRIWANGGDGINLVTSFTFSGTIIDGCTIHGNTGDGIDIANADTAELVVITNCNITGNGGYGIRGVANAENTKCLIDYNNFGTGGLANTSGSMLSFTAGAHDLAVDPGYTDASTGDFTPASAVKAKGFPTVGGTILTGAGTNIASHVDLGAIQAEEAGGGTGSIFSSPIIRGVH